MNVAFKIFLVLHIIGGSLGLVTGFLNILGKKGSKKHVIIGKIFSYSMLTAGISSLFLSTIHPNYFLFVVGMFTLYMVATGNRYIHNKNGKPERIDWMITYTMLLAATLFIGFGIWNVIKSNFFGFVSITFGFVGLRFVRTDLKNYKGKSEIQNYGLVTHLQRMIGAFIAALTAFIVVNEKYFPQQISTILYWLLPTILFTPLIIMWSRKFGLKKK